MTDTVTREQAATERRKWVRTIRACNNRCTFCLDADMLDGFVVPPEEVRRQIREGREEGAERLILSGGEASIHPNFLEFVAYGRECGYTWIQTITNGRRFSYGKFTARAKALGLDEVTFSIHGHTPELHDALTGIQGGFLQALKGLVNARRVGLVANVDVVLNRQNVPHLKEILDFFMDLGVHEFDLLWLVPFGRGFTPRYRDWLFLPPGEAFPHIQRALEGRKRPGLYLWTNRFPVEHLEGYEWLIQEPYKILDEVNGRREMFAEFAAQGDEALSCLGERCAFCFMERYCTAIRRFRARLVAALDGPSAGAAGLHVATLQNTDGAPPGPAFLALVKTHPLRRIEVAAPDAAAARALLATATPVGPAARVLDLDDYADLATAGDLGAARVTLRRPAQQTDVARLLAADPALEVELFVNQATFPLLATLAEEPPALPRARTVLTVENRSRLTEAEREDVSPADIAAALASIPNGDLRVRNLPPCLTAGHVQDDEAFVAEGWDRLVPGLVREETTKEGEVGQLDPFAFTDRFLRDHYYAKSLRCAACPLTTECRGLHINAIRAFGFGVLKPEKASALRAGEARNASGSGS